MVKERRGLVIATVSASARSSSQHSAEWWKFTIQPSFLTKESDFVLGIASDEGYNDGLDVSRVSFYS
jgi:hypothetical protein